MKLWQSNVGWALTGLYVATAVFLIHSQGLYSESLIAVKLGLPWSVLVVLIGVKRLGSGSVPSPLCSFVELYAPMVLNASLLYLIGFGLERLFRYRQPRRVYRKDRP